MTCIACASALYSYAFCRLWGSHRSLRGSGAFALAFLLAAITCILIPFVPLFAELPRTLSIVFSDTSALVVYALLLTGITQFFGARRLKHIGWILILASLPLNIYFTSIRDSLSDRLILNGIFTCIFRLLIGLKVLQEAQRKHVRTLAAVMFLFAFLSMAGVWDVAAHAHLQTSEQWLQSRGPEGLAVFLQFVFVLATGQLLFLLLTGELLRQVEDEATRDFMTGTLNRRGIERALLVEIGRSNRFGIPLTVALIDVDAFKQINDSLGHAEGDRTLLSVSRSIGRSLRAYDTIGRYGGDEFLVILPNSTAIEALHVMERVRKDVAAVASESPTLSIGITSLVPGEAQLDLIARADQALYAAKDDGRNCTRMILAPKVSLMSAE